jgi:hypothetical protein
MNKVFRNDKEALDWALTYIQDVVGQNDLQENIEYLSAVETLEQEDENFKRWKLFTYYLLDTDSETRLI